MKMQHLNHSHLEELIQNLNRFRSEMFELKASGLIGAAKVHADHRANVGNLMHYIALRQR